MLWYFRLLSKQSVQCSAIGSSLISLVCSSSPNSKKIISDLSLLKTVMNVKDRRCALYQAMEDAMIKLKSNKNVADFQVSVFNPMRLDKNPNFLNSNPCL